MSTLSAGSVRFSLKLATPGDLKGNRELGSPVPGFWSIFPALTIVARFVFPIAAVLAGIFFLGHTIPHWSVGCLIIVIMAATLRAAVLVVNSIRRGVGVFDSEK